MMKDAPPYRIEFVCPLEKGDSNWHRYGGSSILGVEFGGEKYPSEQHAIYVCNSLIFRYHKVRVVDSNGKVRYWL